MLPRSKTSILSVENIAVFSLLHSIPVPPSRNSTGYLSASGSHRSLSFDLEWNLTSTLTFLAHSKDDIDYISALCLEEECDLGDITVNRADCYDDENAIIRIKQDFESRFATLVKEASGECRMRCSCLTMN